MLPESSLLIGSTAERLALREEIDRAYKESAKIDQIKDANKQQEESARINIANRRKKLREKRAAHVFTSAIHYIAPNNCCTGSSYFSGSHQLCFQG